MERWILGATRAGAMCHLHGEGPSLSYPHCRAVHAVFALMQYIDGVATAGFLRIAGPLYAKRVSYGRCLTLRRGMKREFKLSDGSESDRLRRMALTGDGYYRLYCTRTIRRYRHAYAQRNIRNSTIKSYRIPRRMDQTSTCCSTRGSPSPSWQTGCFSPLAIFSLPSAAQGVGIKAPVSAGRSWPGSGRSRRRHDRDQPEACSPCFPAPAAPVA